MFPRGNSFLILHKESFSRATASRMAMAEGRGSENNRQWRLQWDLPVEILLPKHHQRYSLCLAAGGDVSLHSYLSGQAPEESQLSMLACFLIYHSVPTPRQLAAGGLEGESGIGIQGDPASSVTGQLFLALQQPGNTVVLRLLRGKKGSWNFGSSVPCLGLGQECHHIHEGAGAYPRNPVPATHSCAWAWKVPVACYTPLCWVFFPPVFLLPGFRISFKKRDLRSLLELPNQHTRMNRSMG